MNYLKIIKKHLQNNKKNKYFQVKYTIFYVET